MDYRHVAEDLQFGASCCGALVSCNVGPERVDFTVTAANTRTCQMFPIGNGFKDFELQLVG